MVFRPYPQLIRGLFNARQFGPPRSVTNASTWSWVAHPVSGLPHATYSPYSDSLSLWLRLSSLNLATYGNSLAHAKGTLSGLIFTDQRPLAGCKHIVSDSISLPSKGFFSPFPRGTCSLSVTSTYLALDNGLPRFIQDSTCPVLLRKQLIVLFF